MPKDATEFLSQQWVQDMLADTRVRTTRRMRKKGVVDPREIESEVLQQQAALKEELLSDLPDEYLDEDELTFRRERQSRPWELED